MEQRILKEGFYIIRSKLTHLNHSDTESFYAEHHGKFPAAPHSHIIDLIVSYMLWLVFHIVELFHCVINSHIFDIASYSPQTTGSQPSWCTGFNANDCIKYTENLFTVMTQHFTADIVCT